MTGPASTLGGLPWRTGRHVGRTIYPMAGGLPSDDDELIGVMDTPELACEAVTSHDAALLRRGGTQNC